MEVTTADEFGTEAPSNKDRTAFRFNYRRDLILITEVTSRKPFLLKGKEERNLWNDIAKEIGEKSNGNCTPRCARERLKRLRSDARKEDFANRYKSGTEEEHSDLKQMILDLDNAITDNDSILKEQESEKSKKTEKEMEAAKDVREAAMSTRAKRSGGEESDNVTPKIKRVSESSYLDLWRKKVEKEESVKSQEMQNQIEQQNLDRDIKREELQLQKERLDFDRMKYEDEKLERAQRFELEKEERKAQLKSNEVLLQIISTLSKNTAGASLPN